MHCCLKNVISRVSCRRNTRLLSSSSSQENFYDILGVDKAAKKHEIKAAFVKLSKLYHPDSNSKSSADSESFIKVCDAYKILGNAETKAVYDYQLLRKENPIVPPPNQAMSRYYRDGTIFPQTTEYDPSKNRFSNSQIVVAAIIFAFFGAAVQLSLVRYFSAKNNERAEEIHLDALAQLEKVRAMSALKQTPVQLALADSVRSSNKSSNV